MAIFDLNSVPVGWFETIEDFETFKDNEVFPEARFQAEEELFSAELIFAISDNPEDRAWAKCIGSAKIQDLISHELGGC